ncbi:MAG: PQQ-dependent sugar dehydrogenase [Verrucomicrobia bacterium]|nr:PQQ-dependent sugar dehydrogenase [Verrucomicrobiota bacterium]
MRCPAPLLFALCAGGLLASIRGADAALECRWADTPPVIDGKGDEAVWQRASVISDFKQGWLPGVPAPRQGTRARLLWDREWIYFLAELDDADVTAEVRAHDGPMWKNDVFEIFLKPSEAHTGYYEFEVNPFAAIVDAFFPDAASRQNPRQLTVGRFHVEARVVVRGTLNDSSDRDAGWTVEGRIPWTDFAPTGGRPGPGEVWRATLTRVDGTGATQELSSVAPLAKPSFHRTEDYVPLRFVGPTPVARGAWRNTRLAGTPDGPEPYATVPAWPRLAAQSLVALVPEPGGGWVWFVDHDGDWSSAMRIGRMRSAGDGSDAATLLKPDEQVTSLVFHPRFAENGFVYLGANGPRSQAPRSSHVLRYTWRDGQLDPASRVTIIEWPSDGHNGCGLAFGRDGRLFVTSGDGSSESDRDRVGQDPGSMRSKILRLDVDHPAPGKNYAVPADNPFVDDARFVPEAWAYGLRNPWRLTYDAASDQLWCGENGQDAWEYAHLVRRGANYGWSVMEGSHRHIAMRPPGPHPFTAPTVEFSHAEFRSLSGGVVYRGKKFPELTGAYVFGDFGTGRVWAAKHDGTKLEWLRELVDTPFAITHVTTDGRGEIVVTDYGSSRSNAPAQGGLHRLERSVPAAPPLPEFPRRLSETGVFADTATLTPAAGVMAYDINAPGWHDGASAVRHLAVPEGGRLDYTPNKAWDAPNGAVLMQTLTLGGRRIETRLLVRRQADWSGYSYQWDENQRDATLADKAGVDLTLANGQPWRVPSRAECMMCHTREANFALTLNEGQLNRGDQLLRWEAMGLVRSAPPRRFRSFATSAAPQRAATAVALLPRAPAELRKYAAAGDAQAPLEQRARSYLAVNCAHCHTTSGGGNSPMVFDFTTPADRMRTIDAMPVHGDFGQAGARVVAPGEAARSVVITRMAIRSPGQMPPLATRVADPDGVRLLAEWIQSLPAAAGR